MSKASRENARTYVAYEYAFVFYILKDEEERGEKCLSLAHKPDCQPDSIVEHGTTI